VKVGNLVCADPFLLPHMQVDKGAIKFILSGANVMCPGLTSPGARVAQVPSESVVVSLYYFRSVTSWFILHCIKIYLFTAEP